MAKADMVEEHGRIERRVRQYLGWDILSFVRVEQVTVHSLKGRGVVNG